MEPQIFIKKTLSLIKHRPGHIYSVARCYLLFLWARFWRHIFTAPGVSLKENVRLQKNSSIMAESPLARISIGKDCIIYEDAQIEAYGKGEITIDESSIIGEVKIFSRFRIQIGKRFLCSWNVFIQDYDSHPTNPEQRRQQVENIIDSFSPRFSSRPQKIQKSRLEWDFPGESIIIGDDVWVGAGCTILKGAMIGSGSVIASGSVVLRGTYPENSLIAGSPAVVVKSLIANQENS